MGLTRKKVKMILSCRNKSFEESIDGFRYGDWLLKSGGGIAGQGDRWFFWNMVTNEKTMLAGSLSELMQILEICPYTCKEWRYKVSNSERE